MIRLPAVMLLVVALSATLLRAEAEATEAETEGDCFSYDDPLQELRLPISRPGPRPKAPKSYPPGAPVARRRGLDPPLTTLFNIHEREALPVFRDRRVPEPVLAELFRCRGFGEPGHLDPRLVEMVLDAAEEFEAPRVEIISAYRSPKFNDALAKKGRGVAPESRHTRGEAIDFRLEGTGACEVGRWLWENRDCGVGVYAADDFVHADVGPKRRWGSW
ncbi:MAG: DUF882 domain-containing protein [Polyangia bacterium]